MVGNLSPPFFEGVSGGTGRIYVRGEGEPIWNGTAHEEGDPTPTDPKRYFPNAGTWEVGDMLVAFADRRSFSVTTGWTSMFTTNYTYIYIKTAEGSDSDPSADEIALDGATSDGDQAIFYTQVISLACTGGGAVEYLTGQKANNREIQSLRHLNPMLMPSLGVGPNPNDTMVIGAWHDFAPQTREDLEAWGTPKGYAVQTITDNPGGLTILGEQFYGNPDSAPPHEPWYEIGGYPYFSEEYWHKWSGWGYQSQYVSVEMPGGSFTQYPGTSATPFHANSNYTTCYLRFGINE